MICQELAEDSKTAQLSDFGPANEHEESVGNTLAQREYRLELRGFHPSVRLQDLLDHLLLICRGVLLRHAHS